MKKHDVIIIGGGPGGSVLGAYLAKQGVDVAIIERETYPRFHIGESLLPSSMPIFKEIGFYETLDSGKYIRKYGARFVDYRHPDEIYFGFQDGMNRDIPMAFEVPRAEFDRDILEHSKKCGTKVYQPERVKDVKFFDSSVTITTNQDEYEAKFVVDASGRDAILGKTLKIRKTHDDLNNVAVFSHYVGVKRRPGLDEGDILIGLLPNAGWSWVIPFKGDRTSVGVVCNAKVFKGQSDLGAYMEEQLNQSAHIREWMSGAERVQEINIISNYSHHCEKFAGDRWLMIGDAAVFLDPIFSSGLHVSVTSAKFASKAILECLSQNKTLSENGLAEKYQADVNRGVHRFHNLISLFYNTNFVQGMKKTLTLEKTRQAFTSAVAGDMWNEENHVFQMKVL